MYIRKKICTYINTHTHLVTVCVHQYNMQNTIQSLSLVYPCTGIEALYRTYGPEGGYRYSSTLS